MAKLVVLIKLESSPNKSRCKYCQVGKGNGFAHGHAEKDKAERDHDASPCKATNVAVDEEQE